MKPANTSLIGYVLTPHKAQRRLWIVEPWAPAWFSNPLPLLGEPA